MADNGDAPAAAGDSGSEGTLGAVILDGYDRAYVLNLARTLRQARPDTPEASARRRTMITRAKEGEYHAVVDELFAGFVHPSRQDDPRLRQIMQARRRATRFYADAQMANHFQWCVAAAPTPAWAAKQKIAVPKAMIDGKDKSISPVMTTKVRASAIIPNCGVVCAKAR